MQNHIKIKPEFEEFDQDFSLLLHGSVHIKVDESRDKVRVILGVPGNVPAETDVVLVRLTFVFLHGLV